MRDFFRIFDLKLKNIFGCPETPTWLIDKSLLLKSENPQIIGSLLYSFDTKSKHNLWYHCPILLEAASTVIQEICQNTSFGRHRRLLPILAESYPLIAKYIPELKDQFEMYLHSLAEYFAKELLSRKDLTQLTSANIGYGTNHLSVELKGVTQYLNYCSKKCGKLVGIDKSFLKEYLQRFMEYMHPAGYWAECDGPALNYNTLTAVSLLAVADELDAFKYYQNHFKKTSEFHTYATLPNGRYIDILDGRNSNCFYQNRGAFLTLTPEGNHLYEIMLANLEATLPNLELFGEPLALLLFDEKMRDKYGVNKSKSIWSKKRIQKQLGDFLILKNQTWIAGVSNFKFRPRPEGHFNLDYQNLLSLYHVEFGEIWGGQNSKNDPEISFFSKFMNKFDGYPVKTPMPIYIPENGKVELNKDSFVLKRDYRGFEGQLEVQIINEKKIELVLSARARADEYPIQCNLILPCGSNAAFYDSRLIKIPLEKEDLSLTNVQTGPFVCFDEKASLVPKKKGKNRRLKISVPDEATIKWPFKPWDTYNLISDRELLPKGWFCIMVIDLTNTPTRLQIEVF